MRKPVLMMLMGVLSSTAAAEWVEVRTSGTDTAYFDPSTTGKAGDTVKMWVLVDFKAVQSRPYGTPYLSQKTQEEYDCKEQRARTARLLRYSENMGGGEEVPVETDSEDWKAVSPGSVVQELWKIACRR